MTDLSSQPGCPRHKELCPGRSTSRRGRTFAARAPRCRWRRSAPPGRSPSYSKGMSLSDSHAEVGVSHIRVKTGLTKSRYSIIAPRRPVAFFLPCCVVLCHATPCQLVRIPTPLTPRAAPSCPRMCAQRRLRVQTVRRNVIQA